MGRKTKRNNCWMKGGIILSLLAVLTLLLGEPIHVIQAHAPRGPEKHTAAVPVSVPAPCEIYTFPDDHHSHEHCNICDLFWTLSHTIRFTEYAQLLFTISPPLYLNNDFAPTLLISELFLTPTRAPPCLS